MYTKCVWTVPVSTVNAEFTLNFKSFIGIIRGTMYTKCVSTVLLARVNADFTKKVVGISRGRMYTKCVWTVALTTVNAYFPYVDFSLNLKKVFGIVI